jgi:hypothetical protein
MAQKPSQPNNPLITDLKKTGLSLYEDLRTLGEWLEKTMMTAKYSGARGLDIGKLEKEAEYVDKMKMAVIRGYGDMRGLMKRYSKKISDIAHYSEGLIMDAERYGHDRPSNIKDMLSPMLDGETISGVKSIAGRVGKTSSDLYKTLFQAGKYSGDKKQMSKSQEYAEKGDLAGNHVYDQAKSDAAGALEKAKDYRQDNGIQVKGKPKGAEALLAIMFVLSLSFLGLSAFHGAQNVELVDSLGTTGMFIGPTNALGDSIWSVYTESIGFVYIVVSVSVLAIFGIGRMAKQW